MVHRGAKLPAKEKYKMVNVFVDSAFQDDDELYLTICQRICRKSDITLSNIMDQNGNNPMHLAVLKTDDNDSKKNNNNLINYKFIRQKIKALKLLYETFPNWSTQKNKEDMYPLNMSFLIPLLICPMLQIF